MANNYYEATGQLTLNTITPVIRALFGGFNLGDDVRDGAVYIAQIDEDTDASWDTILEALLDLAEERGLDLPGDASNIEIKDALALLAASFKATDDAAVKSLIECDDFDGDADPTTLFNLAAAFDDGHGLSTLELEGCWRCDKPRPFEFGGHGVYVGPHYSVATGSNTAINLGKVVEQAIAAGDVAQAAQAITAKIDDLLNGVVDDSIRVALRRQIGTNLAA